MHHRINPTTSLSIYKRRLAIIGKMVASCSVMRNDGEKHDGRKMKTWVIGETKC